MKLTTTFATLFMLSSFGATAADLTKPHIQIAALEKTPLPIKNITQKTADEEFARIRHSKNLYGTETLAQATARTGAYCNKIYDIHIAAIASGSPYLRLVSMSPVRGRDIVVTFLQYHTQRSEWYFVPQANNGVYGEEMEITPEDAKNAQTFVDKAIHQCNFDEFGPPKEPTPKPQVVVRFSMTR